MAATVLGSRFTCKAPSVVESSEESSGALSTGLLLNVNGNPIALSNGSQMEVSTTEPQMRQGCTPSKSFLLLVNGWVTLARPLAMFRLMRRFSAFGDISSLPKMRSERRFQMWLLSVSPLGTMTSATSPLFSIAIKSAVTWPSVKRSAAPSRTSAGNDLFTTISLRETSATTSSTFICSTGFFLLARLG